MKKPAKNIVSKTVKKPVKALKATAKSSAKTSKVSAKKPLVHHVAHHAKRLYRLTPKFIHGMVAGAFVGIVVVMTLHATVPVSALSIEGPRDCDSNAVMHCGARTTDLLKQKYSYKGVADIYNYFGISAKDVSAMGTTAVAGLIWDDGDVSVNGIPVATNAITAGRENISGSTKVTHSGTTFYKRSPKVSFNRETLAAYIVMEKGVFQYAIIAACGNPVIAKPIPKATPKPPKPTPQPPAVITPSTQTPPSTPIPETQIPETQAPVVVATSTTSTPTALPNTGPGAVIVIAILSVVGGYIFHMTHRHVRSKRRPSHHA